MTLIPVSNISVVGVSASSFGASRWIGQRSTSSGSGSPRSIGSPSRLKIRPSVPGPTGTVIGAPVSSTSVPRDRPSVMSIATARTRSSPRCCWTSHTRTSFPPAAMSRSSSSRAASGLAIVIAWLISGSRSGNTASITTPWISTIRPTFLVSVVSDIVLHIGSAEPFSAGDDFHDLLRDLRLAGSVHLQRQILDQRAGVLGRVAHRGHPRTMLGRGRLEQRPVDRDLDVVGHQALEDLLRLGLVLDQRPVLAALAGSLLI